MIAVIDYGMGNLRSVQKAFEFIGMEAVITADKKEIKKASHVVLPGVGAFKDAVNNLKKAGLIEGIYAAIKSGKPFLGICLGMQLLLEKSYEFGVHEGLSIIKGDVVQFKAENLIVPHMGWNTILTNNNPLIESKGDKFLYFAHSFHAKNVPEQYIMAKTNYGYDFASAIIKDNVYGLQFHPEKSGDTGLGVLKKFGGLK